jgi:soluble lytic murein transglycosylase-like protein
MTSIRQRFGRSSIGRAIAALTLGVLVSAAARADIYVLVEKDGSVRFSNVPNDSRYRLYHREPTAHKLNDAPEARNVRNPGDYRLRAPWGRQIDQKVLANPRLAQKPFQEHVVAAAKQTNLDPALIHAVIVAESNYNPNAVSAKGAQGLMQLLPDTARRYGVMNREIKQPEKNIKAGAQYLADLLQMFDGDVRLALAGYNAGENSVVRYGNRIPPYAETRAYVPRVLSTYDQLRLR